MSWLEKFVGEIVSGDGEVKVVEERGIKAQFGSSGLKVVECFE